MLQQGAHKERDQLLLARLGQGDAAAFDELFGHYSAQLFDIAWKSLKDDEKAREIVHDVLLEIWRRSSKLEIVDLGPYLRSAVRNRVISYVSRNRHIPFFEVFDAIASSPYKTDDYLLEKDLLQVVTAYIEVLPPRRKEVFVKYFFEQLSTREIATELGLSQNTVQNHVGTTLAELREKFGHILPILFFI